MMDANEILDIIERKAKGAFVRELGIYDEEVVDSAKARWEHSGEDKPDLVPGSWLRRIDALDFCSTMRTAFEVKASRSDWRRETEEKRRAWRSVTHRYVYVSPEGVIPIAEVPNDCGLWWIVNGQIQVVKRAPKKADPKDIPWRVTMNLCYREQKLRAEVKKKVKDYQWAYKRCERLLADLRTVLPGYTELL